MPIARFNALQKLVKSLTKAEKRHFILYANRLTSNRDVLFLKLFTTLGTPKAMNEKQVYNKLKPESKDQFINSKRHLYSQILKSLRLQEQDSDKLRQKLDYAHILYNKGCLLYTSPSPRDS